MRTTPKIAMAGALAAAMCATTLPASAQTVGKMTAERAEVSKLGVGRIVAGADIALGDRLQSNASGGGMIVFEDESSARLGSNADLTIDEFVYNPGQRSGTIRLFQRAGTARIFGGQISKRGTSEVRTPHIVLGVRGGIADLTVDGESTVATLRAGVMECTSEDGNQSITITNPEISCVGDDSGVSAQNIEGGGGNFVDPGSGAGNGQTGGGSYGGHCSSAAGTTSGACSTSDTALPGPQPFGGGDGTPGGGPGGTVVDDNGGGECDYEFEECPA